MTAGGRRRLAGLVLSTLVATPASAQTTVGPEAAAPGKHAYVNAFCLVVAGGYVDDDYAKFLGEWHARPASTNDTEAARPSDATAPGQMVRFTGDAAAPAVIVDPRRSVCSLIWSGAQPSAAALEELAKDKAPVGQKGALVPWRRVVNPARVGPPKPPRYILLVGASEVSGVCAERRDDLRRHDGAVVSMLQLAPCRLAAGEKAIDG